MVLSVRAEGEGRPVVVLPWFGVDGSFAAAAVEPVFADIDGWRRWYVDLPGTGESPPVDPSSDAGLDALEETVSATLGLAPFHLAGCSYGGYLAAGLVRRIPDRVRGLLLVCSGVKIGLEQRNLRGVLASSPQPGWLADVPEELRGHFEVAVGRQTRGVASLLAAAFQGNGSTDDGYLDDLRANGYPLSDEDVTHRYDGAVTILAGRHDRIAGHVDQLDALGRYPHGSYVALADAGHYLPFEQPDRFTALTLDWLFQGTNTGPVIDPLSGCPVVAWCNPRAGGLP